MCNLDATLIAHRVPGGNSYRKEQILPVGKTGIACGVIMNAAVFIWFWIGLTLASMSTNNFFVSVMTTFSLVQALFPAAPSAKSASFNFGGQTAGGQTGSATNPFSLLVPSDEPTQLSALKSTTSASSLLSPDASVPENQPTDLVALLAGMPETEQQGSAPAIDPSTLEVESPEIAPTVEEIVPVDAPVAVEGDVAQISGAEALGAVTATAQTTQAATAEGIATQAPAVTAAAAGATAGSVPAGAEGALKPVAPNGAHNAQAATPALQPSGDVLEGGQGAPAAQKLLGVGDPKQVSETAQRDPAAATVANANGERNGARPNDTPNPMAKPFGVNAEGASAHKNPFVDGVTTSQAEAAAQQRSAPQAPPPPAGRPDILPQQTASLDIATGQSVSSDGALLPDQRPPVTVTVQFNQTIHGPQLAAQQLAFQIKRNFANGVNRFEVRLDPPELGRIDVRLDMNADGRVSAALTVDRPETLDLLQRDARLLQKALAEAGVDVDDSALNFSLRDENGQAANKDSDTGGAAGGMAGEAVDDDRLPSDNAQHMAIIEDDRVDIRV